MAQEFNDAMFADSMMEDSTMVDSTIVEEFPLDNPVTQAILARRSIRKYLDKPVEHEKLAYLVECGINAPSGSNRQPWVLRVVGKPGAACSGQQRVQDPQRQTNSPRQRLQEHVP